MKEIEFEKITRNLLETFIISGKIALDLRDKGLITKIKLDNTPVTNGDLKVNEKLCNKIKSITPNIPIVSEETVELNKRIVHKNFWLVDPIDGTSDYINNKDQFTLNAALIINLEPVIGIIYAPALKRLFYSYGFANAFEKSENKIKSLNCKKKNKSNEIIAVSYSSTPSDLILNIHKEYQVNKFIEMRSSYKFCVIASGEFDLYATEARAREWDIAAGHAILKHAGGLVTDIKGNEFKYGKEEYKNTSLLLRRSNDLSK